MSSSGAELLVNQFAELGLTEIFTLVGDHLNEILLTAGDRPEFRIIDMRHEAAVAHAADVWARLQRRPAVALVTGGPGHTNALTGLATAQAAGSPLILISGSRPARLAGKRAFQDADQVGSARPLCKWAGEPVSTDEIPALIRRAYAEACTPPQGAVHLTIPVDLLTGQADAPESSRLPPRQSEPDPDTEEVCRRAAELLASAERPVLVAGGGLWWSADAAHALRRFAELSQIPVFTISLGRGALSDEHPLCFGYADPSLNRTAAQAFREADVVLVIGKRMDFRLGFGQLFSPAARLIQVDTNPGEFGLNRTVDLAVRMDAAEFLLRQATGAWPERSSLLQCPWLQRLRCLRINWHGWLDRQAQDNGDGRPIHPAALFAELRSCLPADVLYSWDGGDLVHWGRAMLPAREPGGWIRLGPMGTIGAALPNAIALQMRRPNRPVAMITGDGALGFYISEMDSLVRHQLPVVIIVGNDAGWGLERELQGGQFQGKGRTVGCELRSTRYDKVMEGFGGVGEHITRLEQVRPALERAFARRSGPTLLNVEVRGVRSPFTRWKLGDAE